MICQSLATSQFKIPIYLNMINISDDAHVLVARHAIEYPAPGMFSVNPFWELYFSDDKQIW